MNQDDKINKKTAKGQFEVYLRYLQKHEVLRLGWVMQRSHMAELNDVWEKMAKDLNDCEGPAREISHWKKVFTEWKSHTRRKLKYHRFLNDIEKSLIEITGMTEEDCVIRRVKPKKQEAKEETKEIDISEMQNENFRRVLTNDKNVSSKPKTVLILQEGPKIKNPVPIEEHVQIKEEKIDDSYEKQTVEPERLTPNSASTATSLSSANRSVNDSSSKRMNSNDKENDALANKPGADCSSESQCKRAKLDTASKPKTRDFCVQTPTSNGENSFSFSRQDGLFYIGNAFLTVSRAINRYCDILEKRLV